MIGAKWRISFEIYCVKDVSTAPHAGQPALRSRSGSGRKCGWDMDTAPRRATGRPGCCGGAEQSGTWGRRGRGAVTGQAEEGASRRQAPREAGTPWQKQRASDEPPAKETPEEGLASSWVGFPPCPSPGPLIPEHANRQSVKNVSGLQQMGEVLVSMWGLLCTNVP